MPARRSDHASARAAAIVVAAVADSDQAAAATGIPARTIRKWRQDAQPFLEQDATVMSTGGLAAYVTAKKIAAAVAVASELEELAIDVIKCAREAKEPRDAQVAREKAVTFGIMTDKLAVLLNGASPGRFGTHSSGAGVTLDGDDLVERAITRAQGGTK